MTEFSEDSGFEHNSEDEIMLDSEIPGSTPNNLDWAQKQREDSKVIPHIPLAQSGHSLEPDMMFG